MNGSDPTLQAPATLEIRPRGVHGAVVDRLGLAIGAGQLRPGDQISVEQLGQEFGISRTVVREVLRVLESKGLIVARPRTGTRVTPVDMWDLLDRDVILWRVHGPDRNRQLEELVALR